MEKATCIVDGCERPILVQKRGWCSLHFQRWQRHGDPTGGRPSTAPSATPKPREDGTCACGCGGVVMAGKVFKAGHQGRHDAYRHETPCAVNSCDLTSKSRGYCARHYANLLNYGDPLSAADRTPMQRLEHIGWDVTEAGCWEWRGNRNRAGYGRLSVDHIPWLAPRLMLSLTDPRDDLSTLIVRHACDNPPCCNPAHLSWGSPQDNSLDMVERVRGTSHAANWWEGLCKKGLHDITKPGALTRKPNKRSALGYENRCTECMKATREREKAARKSKR